jgi:hypothetical protein
VVLKLPEESVLIWLGETVEPSQLSTVVGWLELVPEHSMICKPDGFDD